MTNHEIDFYRQRLLKLYKNYRLGAIASFISVLILTAFVVLSTKSNGYNTLETIATVLTIGSLLIGIWLLKEMKLMRQFQRNHIEFRNKIKKEE